MRHLLDTSALLAHFRAELGGAAVQAIFEDAGSVTLISSLSIVEFCRRLGDLGADEASIADAMGFYASIMEEVVSVDAAVAWEAERLQRATPSRLPHVDALIAACAATRHAVLVHRDSHLRAIPSNLLPQLDLERLSATEGSAESGGEG